MLIIRWLAGVTPRRLKWILKCLRQQPLETIPDSPELFRLYRSWLAHPEIKRVPGGWIYQGERYPDYLTAGGAGCAIFPTALRHCRGRGVDFGAGYWTLPGAMPIDPHRGEGMRLSLDEVEGESLDYIFSSHCLEHIRAWEAELARWAEKVRAGGVVFLYLPHPGCLIWRPGSPFVGDGHVWTPTFEVVRAALERLSFEIVAFDEGPDAMQSFFLCAKKGGTSAAGSDAR